MNPTCPPEQTTFLPLRLGHIPSPRWIDTRHILTSVWGHVHQGAGTHRILPWCAKQSISEQAGGTSYSHTDLGFTYWNQGRQALTHHTVIVSEQRFANVRTRPIHPQWGLWSCTLRSGPFVKEVCRRSSTSQPGSATAASGRLHCRRFTSHHTATKIHSYTYSLNIWLSLSNPR